jgi:GT2 family glycosyltransferase
MKVAVVILNYNGKKFLEQFLPGVIAHSAGARIVVADNASTDGSVDFIKKNYPGVQVVVNSANGGFAKGYNDALKHVEAEYYVLLNSDIEVTAGWIEPCTRLLDSDPGIAALQPKVLAYYNKKKFEHAGAAGGYLDKNFYPFCRGRMFEYTEDDQGQYNDSREVFWATGACLFIRSKVYHEMGGLDEDFFAHMEEIDLCWRLKRHGHKIYYCGKSAIYHVGGGTLNYLNPSKTFLNFRNSLFMIAKNYEGALFFKILWRLVLDGIAAGLFLVKFQWRHFLAVWRAHFAFYASVPSLLRKRKALKASAGTLNKTGLYRRNIVFRKFLSGIKEFSALNPKDFY